MTQSPRQLLQYHEVLQSLAAPTRNKLYERATIRQLQVGEVVLQAGDGPPYFVAAVMSGRLRMFVRAREGREMLMTMAEKGELCGEMSVLDDMPRAVNVVADAPSTVMLMSASDLLEALYTHPAAMHAMVRMTCHRMRLYIHTLELIALQSVQPRVVRYLLRLARDYGHDGEGQIIIQAHLSQSAMARQLALTRESVNKQLHILAEYKLLQLHGDEIILTDVAGLKELIRPQQVT